MGEIKEHAQGDEYYYSDAGYVVPVKPKTRSVYDYEARKHKTLPDYTLEQFVFAEQQFNLISEIFDKEYGGEFIIKQSSERNRIASVAPKCLLEVQQDRQLWGWSSWVDLAFFTLSLQQGVTYNFPSQKLSQVFKVAFDIDSEIYKGGGNQGFSVEETLTHMNVLKTHVAGLFEAHDAVMTDERFAKMVAMFKMHATGIIMYDLAEWVKYVSADVDLDVAAYGFSKRLFSRKGINFIPVEQVKEYRGLPIEWVERILAEK